VGRDGLRPLRRAEARAGHGQHRRRQDLALQPIGVLAVDPNDADVVYAGADSNQGDGVFKTSDGGATWELTSLHSRFMRALAVAPSDSRMVYGGALENFYVSTDGGATWEIRERGLADRRIGAVAVDPVDAGTVYAGTLGRGVYRSTDAGLHWTPAHQGMGMIQVNAIVGDPASPGTLYAGTAHGVYLTTDGGASWQPMTTGMGRQNVVSLVMGSAHHGRLFAGTSSSGAYRSDDGGSHWTPVNAGLTDDTVGALALDPTDDDVVYAGTGDGLFKTGDAGASWHERDRGASNSDVWSVAAAGTGRGVLYAGTRDQRGVFRSTSGGRFWRQASDGLPEGVFVQNLAVDPADPDTIYAATSYQGVFKTTNGGRSWALLGAAPLGADHLAMAPSDPLTLYGLFDDEVWRTTDGGDSWTDVSAGLPAGYQAGFAIDPTDPMTVFASTQTSGVFKTRNGGDTWTSSSDGLPTSNTYFGPIAMDPATPTDLYVFANQDLYRSTDRGRHWSKIPVPDCVNVIFGCYSEFMVFDPVRPHVLYIDRAAAVGRGDMAAGTWTLTPPVAEKVSLADLAVSPDGSTLFVGTRGGGVASLPAS
jgi:photosystem II stability/assembly factor-like uncharacterized protein